MSHVIKMEKTEEVNYPGVEGWLNESYTNGCEYTAHVHRFDNCNGSNSASEASENSINYTVVSFF